MPGRQAHGRSLIANPKAKSVPKRSKARAQKNALNAFNIAQEHFPSKQKKTPRARELDAEIERKHGRDEEGDEEDDGDQEEDQGPKRKKVKGGDNGVEFGSDSEGNEWQLGGMAEDDDDSEIESDEAFGESDNEMFQGYAFRGSSSKQGNEDADDSDDSNDDEGETLGEDAIDLATALDQYEESDEPRDDKQGDDESGSGGSDVDDESSESDEDADSDDEADPERLKQLQGLISGFGGDDEGEDESGPVQRKIDLSDLGLSKLSDPFMKRSVRLLKKEEEKDRRSGSGKKLEVPLSRREQARLDRSAAYDNTNATLDRWTETVKANRRAEHLSFPLAQNSESLGVDRTELPLLSNKPLLSSKAASSELESTILSIMAQSGLSIERREREEKPPVCDEDGNVLSRKQVLERKRVERELVSREAKRAKRIKKIKSKAYHRVHRRQREREEMAVNEAEGVDSEEEREAHDRRRALERVGMRHKESKWARMGAQTRRAVWDDDFRAGLTEMARRDDELRQRKEGRRDDDDDDGTSDDDDDGDGVDDLRRQLDEVDKMEDEPRSGLMSMKFMQKAEKARKSANDELVRQIRRELDGEEASANEGDEDEVTGRRQYGSAAAAATAAKTRKRPAPAGISAAKEPADTAKEIAAPADTTDAISGAWSRGARRKAARSEQLDLDASIAVMTSKKTPKTSNVEAGESDSDTSDDDSDSDRSIAIRDTDLVARAFAGEDVVADFEREKAAVAEADDDKVIDNTLPGWGSWVGEGVSEREQQRHRGRFLTHVEGVKKGDRRDAKLERVIINEKRVKKNDKYLASQLPHPFESRVQYERSLRLPLGPEWMTKETFQASTKPRVLMKQGVIAPMSRPTI